MADDVSASVIPLHQPRPKKTKTPDEQAKTFWQRKRQKTKAAVSTDTESPCSASLIPLEFLSADSATAEPPVPVAPSTVLNVEVEAFASPRGAPPSRRHAAPVLLTVAALALAGDGITINGWFARSLGSSDVAGWLFLAIGVAADCVALAMPSCAARLRESGQRVTALVGWSVWTMTFVFAMTAGIGFASVNIADATLARASRVTPAVTAAQTALADAMAARDRECKGGLASSAGNGRRRLLIAGRP
jgi:hypothetical protein